MILSDPEWNFQVVLHQLLQKQRLFGILDQNMDDKLQPSELIGRAGTMIKANLAMIDTDHDGVVSYDELMAALDKLPKVRRSPPPAAPAAPVAVPKSSTQNR